MIILKEERIVHELQELNKLFIVFCMVIHLCCESTKNLDQKLEDKYQVSVIPIDW